MSILEEHSVNSYSIFFQQLCPMKPIHANEFTTDKLAATLDLDDNSLANTFFEFSLRLRSQSCNVLCVGFFSLQFWKGKKKEFWGYISVCVAFQRHQRGLPDNSLRCLILPFRCYMANYLYLLHSICHPVYNDLWGYGQRSTLIRLALITNPSQKRQKPFTWAGCLFRTI